MNPLEIFRTALRALRRNKTRSFLTTLGIIIGVAAVIAMVAIGEGAKANVEKTFSSMGTNVLILMPGWNRSGGARGGFGSMPTLTWEDLKAIQTEVPSVRMAAPLLRSSGTVLMSEDQNWTTTVQGTTPDYLAIRNWDVVRGSPLTSSDVESQAKVVLLGSTVAEKLFGYGDPVGQLVRIKNVPFQVTGVLASKGQSPMGQDYDDVALVPVTTFQSKVQGGLGKFLNGVVHISAVSQQATALAQRQITALLRDRHRLGPNDEDDFHIRNLSELAEAQQEGTRTLSALLASIAAVSLLVGGIGIMNIMLVSVTERTREIGIRMAVGARPRDILAQFLVEALSLSLLGGVAGLAVGVLAAQRLSSTMGWPLLIKPEIATLAIAFSALVGVGFGLYPARKASRLDPIDALRYE